jgi:hypothetical protein
MAAKENKATRIGYTAFEYKAAKKQNQKDWVILSKHGNDRFKFSLTFSSLISGRPGVQVFPAQGRHHILVI